MNRIQIKIFEKLATESEMEMGDFLSTYSTENIGREVTSLDELSEEEADSWITKAYLKSLG